MVDKLTNHIKYETIRTIDVILDIVDNIDFNIKHQLTTTNDIFKQSIC